MTDRAQPGAIDSVIRNDELAQVLGQLTGGFDDGWVVDPADPTAASRRRTGINESAFDGFALSNVSSSSLSVDVGPGEAFAGGWLAMDAGKSVTLPANTTSTIVALMDLNAIYDPQNDPDRDAADKVVIDIAANVSDDLPRVQLHEVTTDGSGVTGRTDLRKPYGPALEADSATVDALEAGEVQSDPLALQHRLSSNQSLSANTITTVQFDNLTDTFNSAVSAYSDTANNGFTVPSNADFNTVRLYAHIVFKNRNDVNRVQVIKNGSASYKGTVQNIGAPLLSNVVMVRFSSGIIPVSGGETFIVQIETASSATISQDVGSYYQMEAQ